MALNFPNVSLLSLVQDSRFFDAGFNYSTSKRLTVNGVLLDLINSQGVSGIWTGLNGLVNTVGLNLNFQPLILNGVNFGSGRIQNLSFSPGIDVQTKTYTADLLVSDTGSLTNFTGFYYSGIDISNFQYLQDFSEDYNFTRKENGGYAYTHSASIRFNSGSAASLNAIGAAKALVKTLFTGSNLGFAFYSGYTNKAGKRFYTENYNLIDNACSFNETFDFDSYSGTYSVLRTNKYDLTEAGLITVTEVANIKGIIDPTFETASAALKAEAGGAFSRCSGVYSLYAPGGSYPLLATPLVQSYVMDFFNNNLGYTLGYTTQINNSGLYFWDYTQQIDLTEGIVKAREAGQIQGDGANRSIAYGNAVTAFTGVVLPGLYGRMGAFYLSEINPTPATYFIETQQQAYSPMKGLVTYDYSFTNESVINGTNGTKRIDVKVNGENPVYLYGKFSIVNGREIIQDEQQSTLGDVTYDMTLKGEKILPLSSYLADAKAQLNNLLVSGAPPGNIAFYISEAGYSFSPNSNTVSVSMRTPFNKGAAKSVDLKT